MPDEDLVALGELIPPEDEAAVRVVPVMTCHTPPTPLPAV
jgi:hypothetical protein